jgi:hypothetical protein
VVGLTLTVLILQIRDIAAERLEKSELVQLLGWIRAYA